MFKNKKIVLFLLVLPLVAVLVAPKVALADDDSDWVKNIPIIGGVVDFASDPGGWITDRFAEGAEFFFNDGLQNIKTTSTKSILGKSFNNLLGKKTGTFYSTVSFVNKSVVMPTAASILSLVMLIQLIKISQRIDGTATLPAIKDIALLGFDETKNYGVSFCKNFLATCLAGVIILFAMGLFPNLLSGFSGGEISGFKGDMWSSVCASVALMLIVIKSGTIARDVFGG